MRHQRRRILLSQFGAVDATLRGVVHLALQHLMLMVPRLARAAFPQTPGLLPVGEQTCRLHRQTPIGTHMESHIESLLAVIQLLALRHLP